MRHLRALAEGCKDLEIMPLASGNAEVVVILCGCPRACADRVENRTGTLATVVVAGESVDSESVPESNLAMVVGQKLAEALSQWRSRESPCS